MITSLIKILKFIDPPQGTGVCDWQYGIFGHESSCIRYWTCWNGTSVEQFCIGGLLYNEEKHACDWPEAVEGCQKHRNLILFKVNCSNKYYNSYFSNI